MILESDLPRCKSMLQTYARSQRWRESILLLEDLRNIREVGLDVVSATKLTKACGKAKKWEAAIFIFDSLQSFRIADSILRGAVVSACAASAVWEATLELLKGGLDVVACSSAITACERGQQWEVATTLLQEMHGQRVEPNVITYNAAMSACEKGNSWQCAFELFAEMVELKISPSVISYGAAIAACRRASFWERALDLLGMVEIPNQVIYSSTMEALLEAERWQLALVLWDAGSFFGADAALMSSAMSAWAQGGCWSQALTLLQELRELSMADGMAYTNAINSCEASGHWELALWLLHQSTDSGGSLSLVCRSCVLNVAAQAAVWQLALQLLEGSLDGVACGTALRACGRAGKWQEALELLKKAEENQILGTILCNAAITACDVSAQWQRALVLIKQMRQLRIAEDSITLSAAMGACEKGKQWERALALLVEMQEQRMEGNAIAFTAALTALGHKWQRALLLLEDMKNEQVCPNRVTYTAVMSACGHAARWEVSLLLQAEMEQSEIDPGVLAVGLALSAIEQGSTAVVPGAVAALLQDLAEEGVARSNEIRIGMPWKTESADISLYRKHTNLLTAFTASP